MWLGHNQKSDTFQGKENYWKHTVDDCSRQFSGAHCCRWGSAQSYLRQCTAEKHCPLSAHPSAWCNGHSSARHARPPGMPCTRHARARCRPALEPLPLPHHRCSNHYVAHWRLYKSRMEDFTTAWMKKDSQVMTLKQPNRECNDWQQPAMHQIADSPDQSNSTEFMWAVFARAEHSKFKFKFKSSPAQSTAAPLQSGWGQGTMSGLNWFLLGRCTADTVHAPLEWEAVPCLGLGSSTPCRCWRIDHSMARCIWRRVLHPRPGRSGRGWAGWSPCRGITASVGYRWTHAEHLTRRALRSNAVGTR